MCRTQRRRRTHRSLFCPRLRLADLGEHRLQAHVARHRLDQREDRLGILRLVLGLLSLGVLIPAEQVGADPWWRRPGARGSRQTSRSDCPHRRPSTPGNPDGCVSRCDAAGSSTRPGRTTRSRPSAPSRRSHTFLEPGGILAEAVNDLYHPVGRGHHAPGGCRVLGRLRLR